MCLRPSLVRHSVPACFRSLTSLHPLDGGVRACGTALFGRGRPKTEACSFNGKFVYDTLYATPTARAHSSPSIRLIDTIIITSCTIKLINTFISPLIIHCYSFSRESTYYRSHKRYVPVLSAHGYPYKRYLLSAHALSLQEICYIASALSLQEICYIASTTGTAAIWLCIPVIKSNYFLFTTTCAHSSEVASMKSGYSTQFCPMLLCIPVINLILSVSLRLSMFASVESSLNCLPDG